MGATHPTGGSSAEGERARAQEATHTPNITSPKCFPLEVPDAGVRRPQADEEAGSIWNSVAKALCFLCSWSQRPRMQPGPGSRFPRHEDTGGLEPRRPAR